MFAVLETVTVPPKRRLFRTGVSAEWREHPRYLGITLEMPLGAREKSLRTRAYRAIRYAEGLKGIVLPRDFPYASYARDFGLAVSSPVPLLRRMAPALCRFAAGAAA